MRTPDHWTYELIHMMLNLHRNRLAPLNRIQMWFSCVFSLLFADPGKSHGPVSDRVPGGASRLGVGIHWGAHSGHQNNNVESTTGTTPGRQQKPLKDFSDHLTIYSADEDEWLMMDSGLPGAAVENSWEDRLQETIRFVFSHEQEGLLAIGTFALDQLAGVLEKLPAATATATDSCGGPVAATAGAAAAGRKLELRSSDEEADEDDEDDEEDEVLGSHRQLFGRKRPELPVFGDHDVASVDSPDAKNACDQGGCPTSAVLTVLEPPVTVKQQLHNPSIEPLAKVPLPFITGVAKWHLKMLVLMN